MFRAVLKLTYFPGTRDLVLPESLQKKDAPVMILPPAVGPAGY